MKKPWMAILFMVISLFPIWGEEPDFKENFSVISLGLFGGYTDATITGFGGDIEGPSGAFALQISPSLVNIHPLHLGVRLDLSGNMAYGDIWNQISADIAMDAFAGVFIVDMFYLYAFGGGCYYEYGITLNSDATQSAVEHGFGYRYGGGLQFVIVFDRINYLFVGPEITMGKMYLETVTNDFIRMNLALYFHVAVK